MKRKIFLGIIASTLISLAVLAYPLGRQIFASVTYQTNLELTSITVEAARNVPADFYLPGKAQQIAQKKHVTFSLYDAKGNLLSGDGPTRGDNVVRRALANRITHFERADNLYVAIPLFQDKVLRGVLRGAELDRVEEAKIKSKIILMCLTILFALFTSLIIAFAISTRLSKPVRLLSEAVEKIGSDSEPHAVPKLSVPELDSVGRSINLSNERIAQLVARERAYSSEASHQLRTPIAGMKANIEAELSFPRSDSKLVLLETLSDISRLETIVSELLSLARQEVPSHSIDVIEVLSDAVEGWRSKFKNRARPLIFIQPDKKLVVDGNPLALRHALDVLLDNALIHGTGTTTIECDSDANHVSIKIENEGAVKPQTDSSGGLGLSIANRLIGQINGRLSLNLEAEKPRVAIELSTQRSFS